MKIFNSFDQEVMSYNHSSIDEVDITKLWSLMNISSTRNGDDVVYEPWIP